MKKAISLRFLLPALATVFYISVANAEICYENDFSYNPDNPFFQCHAVCVASVQVSLQCSTFRKNRICTELCGQAKDDTCEGNPINLSNGSKVASETDYKSSGKFPLTIQRFYQSNHMAFERGFGINWSGFVNYQIVSNHNGVTGDRYIVKRSNGDSTHYTWVVNGGGATAPVKSTTREKLTLFNYGVDGIPQVFQLLYPDGREEVYEFDQIEFANTNNYTSRLLWRADANGYRHTYTYNSNGFTITDQDNRQLVITNTPENRVGTIQAPGNKIYRYEYDTVGNLVRVFYPDDTPGNDSDNPFKEYHYENLDFPHHLTGITDERGIRYATYAYDDKGKAVLTEHAGGVGRVEVLAYEADNSVRTRNAQGKETVYQFENAGSDEATLRRLVSVQGEATSNCIASNTSVSYDANGYKDLETDGRGFVSDFDYDAEGFEIKRTEALFDDGGGLAATNATRVVETLWDTYSTPNLQAKLVKQKIQPGKTIDYTYENGRVKTMTETDTTSNVSPYNTNGQSRVWNYTYTFVDADNIILDNVSVDGPRNDVNDRVVQYYNPLGLLTMVERFTSGSEKLTSTFSNHNDLGLPQLIVDENGVNTVLAYSPRGWLEARTTQTTVGNATTAYEYNLAGLVEKITLPNGVELNYEYDAAQRLTAIFTNNNERLEYELDSFGNRTLEQAKTSSNEIRKLQTKEFDDLGRLWKVIGAENQALQTFSYDENDNVTNIADSNLVNLVQAFDGLNRLSTLTDRKGGQVEYTYDGQNNLLAVKDQNDLYTTYIVDGFGRTLKTTSPDTGDTVNEYDEANNKTRSTDARGIVSLYSYDALNRLTAIEYPASPTENINYYYDATSTNGETNWGKGRLTRIVEANGNQIDWVYNQLGLVVADIRTIGGQSYTTRYQYDLSNTLKGIIYPSGREVEYLQDSNGRIDSVRTRKTSSDAWTTLASNIRYRPFGPVESFTYGNNLVQTNDYDLHYRPVLMQAADNALPVQGLDYAYNLNNEIETIVNLTQAGYNQSFIYDDNSRLEKATGEYGIFDYSYDSVGNRLGLQTDNFSENYTYPLNSHRLEGVSSNDGGQNKIFAYSDAGHTTGDGQYTYEYNHRNRLIQVLQNNIPVADYVHNTLGQRISKTFDSETTHFHYGLDNQLIAESQGDGSPSREYIYFNGQRLAIIEVNDITVPEADLAAALTHTRNGTLVDYTITIDNLGPDTAENTTLVNTVPASAVIDVFTPSTGSCTQTGQQLDCTLGDMSNGSSYTLQVQITVPTDVDIEATVTGTVSSDTFDPNLANNTVQQSGQGCFIATAAYGSYEHDYLYILRDFRDQQLLTHASGQWFVTQYYHHSPKLADWIAERDMAKALVRILLIPLIALAWILQASLLVQGASALAMGGLILLWKQAPAGIGLKTGALLIGLCLTLAAGSAKADDIYYVHVDHLNTPTVVTDANQQVVWEGARKPFGETEEIVALINQPFRFPGQYYDVETGLHYSYFRDYDPSTGRYVQADPVGLLVEFSDPKFQTAIAAGLPIQSELIGNQLNHLYAYVGSNPLIYTDPYGLFFFGPVCGSGGSAKFVPDGRFTEACRKHDECYGDCNKTKEQCDLELCLNGACLYGFALDSVFKNSSQNAYNKAQDENGCDDCKE